MSACLLPFLPHTNVQTPAQRSRSAALSLLFEKLHVQALQHVKKKQSFEFHLVVFEREPFA